METPVTETSARRFLLGDADDGERLEIQTRFMTDPQAKMAILLAEETLIEDFLENNLTKAEHEKFLLQYQSTPHQRQKLKVARSIKDWAVSEGRLDRDESEREAPWHTWISQLWAKPWRSAMTAALAILIVIVIGYSWQQNRKRLAQIRQRASVERDLAALNAPNVTQRPDYVLFLAPISVRGVASQKELTLQGDNQTVEVRMLWPEKKVYPTYRTVIHRLGSVDQFTVSNLPPETNGTAPEIRLYLPSRFLTPGLYQITLVGIDASGTASRSEEFSFVLR